MLTTNKLTGEKIEVDHYSDYFSPVVNEYCEKIMDDIFKHGIHIVEEIDVEGTLSWYKMTREQFDKSGFSYHYFKKLDLQRIETFVDMLIGLERSDSIVRDDEKGLRLFIESLKEEWADYVDAMNDSE